MVARYSALYPEEPSKVSIVHNVLNNLVKDVVGNVQERIHVDPELQYVSPADVEQLDLDLAQEVIALEDELVEVEQRVLRHRKSALDTLITRREEHYQSMREKIVTAVQEKFDATIQDEDGMMEKDRVETEEMLDRVMELLEECSKKVSDVIISDVLN